MEQLTATKQLAERVKRLRGRRRWSARQLAEVCTAAGAASLTRSTIAKIESGVRHSVTADEVAALATALGVSAADLLGAQTAAERLLDALHSLYSEAGSPDLRTLADTAGRPRSQIADLMKGLADEPPWRLIADIVRTLNGDVDSFKQLWRAVTDELEANADNVVTPDQRVSKSVVQASSVNEFVVHAPDARLSGVPIPRQLPLTVPSFVGRAVELGKLDILLRASTRKMPTATIAAVSGPPGVGKTTLALHWAHLRQDQFPDGCLYANLDGYSPTSPKNPTEILKAFVLSLGVAVDQIPEDTDSLSALYRSLLTDRRILILLDNALTTSQVAPLLPGTPSCATVVTSRTLLATLSVRYSALDVRVEPFDQAAAFALLSQKIGRDRIDADPPAANRLIELCGGLPLALSMLSAHLDAHPHTTLAQEVSYLRDQVGALDRLEFGDIGIQTVFEWSYKSLGTAAAEAFRLLGVHPAREFDLTAAASILGVSLGDASRTIDELARASLLDSRPSGRIQFHDLLHAYARELAISSSYTERASAARRLLDHYVHSGRNAQQALDPYWEEVDVINAEPGVAVHEFAHQDDAINWFRAERGAIIAALQLGVSVGFDEHVWKLATFLATFLYREGMWHEWADVLELAAPAAERSGNQAAQARIHRMLGSAYARLDRHDVAFQHHELALNRFRTIGDRLGQAHTHLMLGRLYAWEERYPKATSHTEAALQLYKDNELPEWEARALTDLGRIFNMINDPERAMQYCQQALALSEQVHDLDATGAAMHLAGEVCQRINNDEQAIAYLRRALTIRQTIGDRYGQADTLTKLGDTYKAMRNDAAAQENWRQALDIFQTITNREATKVRGRLAAFERDESSQPLGCRPLQA